VAIVSIPCISAKALLTADRIKDGMVSCRMRPADRLDKCFRCIGTGYVASNCFSADRRICCRRCGIDRHYAATCTATIEDARSFYKTLRAESAAGTTPISGEVAARVNRSEVTASNLTMTR